MPGTRPTTYSDTEKMTGTPRADQFPSQGQAQRQPLPLESLTEFQSFVATTTGQILPIYGTRLFSNIPSTFAPNMSPVPPDYVVGPGDELRIRIWGQVNQQANVRVDRSGEIYLPQVGQVHVAGLTFSALDSHLREAVGRVFRNFDLTVDLGEIRAIQIYVAGDARQPGVYTVSSLSTLVDALFASGGPSVAGSLRAIELRRGGTVVTRFDLYDLLVRGDKTKDAKLLSGDVLFIPPAGPQVAVFGSVRTPAIYELLPQEPLSRILADAGGVSSVASQARLSIERIDEHRDRHAMEVAYDAAGLATPLTDGDVIRVYSIVPRYQKTVTLRGNIANAGRFAWHDGMRLSELIPDKESLLTRDYWWRRAQMGLPTPPFEPMPGFASQRQPVDNVPVALPPPRQSTSEDGSDRMNPPGDQQDTVPQDQLSSGSRGLPLSAQQHAGGSTLAAGQRTGTSQLETPSLTPRLEVRLPAPEIDWDYAVIERLDPETLKTVLLPFDLGKLVLQHDATQDLVLQPGDVVSVFSQADIGVPVAEQTKLVRLEGEFGHAGVYSILPGETLRHLVDRAGGFTPNAYIFASEFTRVSTRDIQQARIDEYVQSLTLSIEHSAVNLATASVSSPQALSSGTIAQSGEQSLLNSLRQIRATGRVVLSLKPHSAGVDSLPDIALEDGDRFVVPHVPSTVNVVGSVYDQNSFLYIDHARVGSYLHQAGGPNKEADPSHEFVIRADGEVVSREASNGLWGNVFNNLEIYPGDTIVVPEKVFKPSAIYGFLNWSQMFSQLALGAAAINVLR